MDGTEKSLFKIVGTQMKHFASYVYLKALQAGESIRLRVYNKVDDVSHWKFDNDVTDSVGTNNGTITNISSWVSQWKFDGNVLDSVGSNNGTITYHTNLKRLYKFESNLNDSTAAAANGTLGAGSATYVTGKEGSAFSFDGSTYISAADTGLPTGTNVWSFSCWIQRTTSPAAVQTFFSYGTAGTNQGALLSLDASYHLDYNNYSNGLQILSSGTIPINTWTHVVVTYDGTTIRLYINGVADGSGAYTLGTVLNALNLGQALGNIQRYTGLMDEARFYNITLTQAQVSALYMNGKFAQSHTFDSGELIQIGTSSSLNYENTQALTISCWIKTIQATQYEILGKNSTLRNTGYALWFDGTNIRFSFIGTPNTGFAEASPTGITINDGRWHNIVVTYAGNGLSTGINFYFDGISTSRVDQQNNLAGTSINALTPSIGSDNSGGNLFTGQLDEVRIYTSVLTASQVLGLYNYTGSNFVTPLPTGNALSLDGSSYVTIPNETPYHWERTQAFSIAFWIKSSSMPAQSIMYYKFSGGGAGHLYILNASGYPQLLLRNTPTTNDLNVQTNNNVIDGTWHNVIVTYDGSSNASNVKFYIDGVLKTTTVNSNTLSATIVNTVQPVLGAQTGGGNPYTGLLDEVQIYPYVISSAEINAINAGRFANTHPIGLWHFDGDLYDYSGQGSTGSPTGTMTYVTGALSGSYNVPNTHFNFDGSEYISVANASNLQFSKISPMTISFWIRTTQRTNDYFVINKGAVYAGGYGYSIKYSNNGLYDLLEFLLADSAGNYYIMNTGLTGSLIADGLWHHCVITYDGNITSTSVSSYLDGVSKTNNFIGSTLAGEIKSTVPLVIGADQSNANEFNGELDDLRVYNRALSSAEVSDLFTYPDSAMKQLVYDKQYSGVKSDAIFIPFLPGNDYMVTAQQTNGTNRIINWEREEVS